MLIPETTPHIVNYLINHPEIKPWVCGQLTGVLDATPLIENTDNIFFTAEHGGCGLIKKDENTYELHSFALPTGRGRWVRNNFFKVRDWLFANTKADKIVTMCPVNNKMAIGAARICHFTKYETIEKSWLFDGKMYDLDAYVLYKGVG